MNSDNEKLDLANLDESLKSQIYRLAVIKTSDKYDILRAISVDGINYGLTTEDIIKTLQSWEKKYNLKFSIIFGVATGFEIRLEEVPDNLKIFLKEAKEFCPDIKEAVPPDLRAKYEKTDEKGILYLDNKAMETMIKETKKVYFWWD